MKKITLIETAEELFNIANDTREIGVALPYFGTEVVLVVDINKNIVKLTGDGSEMFMLSDDLSRSPQQVLGLALKRCGFDKVRFGATDEEKAAKVEKLFAHLSATAEEKKSA